MRKYGNLWTSNFGFTVFNKKKCVHAVQDFIYLKNHLNELNSCNFQKSEFLSEKSN